MEIRFLEDTTSSEARIVVYLVNQNALPPGLEPVLVEGAAMSRFAGKAPACSGSRRSSSSPGKRSTKLSSP